MSTVLETAKTPLFSTNRAFLALGATFQALPGKRGTRTADGGFFPSVFPEYFCGFSRIQWKLQWVREKGNPVLWPRPAQEVAFLPAAVLKNVLRARTPSDSVPCVRPWRAGSPLSSEAMHPEHQFQHGGDVPVVHQGNQGELPITDCHVIDCAPCFHEHDEGRHPDPRRTTVEMRCS